MESFDLQIPGKDPDAIDEVERDRAKRIVYGILYGMGARSLSEILNGDSTFAYLLLEIDELFSPLPSIHS